MTPLLERVPVITPGVVVGGILATAKFVATLAFVVSVIVY